MTFIYGKHAVDAALKNPKRVHRTIFIHRNFKDKDWLNRTIADNPKTHMIKVCELESRKFNDHFNLEENSVHQGIILETSSLPKRLLSDILQKPDTQPTCQLLILDQVTDPQNLGAIIRSAVAFQFNGVILSGYKNTLLKSPALFKAASGAAELIPIIEISNLKNTLQELQAHEFWTYGLDEKGTNTIQDVDLRGRVALVLGSESTGLRHLTKKTCDQLVTLPTGHQFSTLNVSSAASVICYETCRQNM